MACGTTTAHRFVAWSPARDHIPAAVCAVAVDQCGMVRPFPPGGNCDVGAYEEGGSCRVLLPVMLHN